MILRAWAVSVFVLLSGTTPMVADTPAPGKQVEQQLTVRDGVVVDYLLYLPHDYDTHADGYPLLFFLHGRGESHGPLSLVKKWGPPRLVDEGRELPYIIVSPQCPPSASWSQAGEQSKLVRLLDHIEQTYPVDKRRIYLTGLSMGGYGSWRLAATHPERFAAVVPICGRGNPADAEKLKDLPIWAWHGMDDGVVPPSGSLEVVEAIRQAGGQQVILTTLEGIGHNSWSSAYGTPELYRWLDRHRLEIVEP